MDEIERLAQWFTAQVGTRETGVNNVIYNTHYYGGAVSGEQYPWCCAFLWDGFRECGLSARFCGGEKTAYCPYVVSWARAHGQWVTGPYRRGDLALFDWDGDGVADHIGFVLSAAGASLTTVEGNASDAVMRLTRSVSSVLGAYRPAYLQEDAAETPAAAPREETAGESYTVQSGDSLWSIAEKRLGSGFRYDELRILNGLSGYTIYPGQVLRLPDTGNTTVTLTLKRAVWEALGSAAQARGLTPAQLIEEVFSA